MESSSSSEGEGEGFEDEPSASDSSDREIHYMVGDVTHPQNTRNSDAIVVHCVAKLTPCTLQTLEIQSNLICQTKFALHVSKLGVKVR